MPEEDPLPTDPVGGPPAHEGPVDQWPAPEQPAAKPVEYGVALGRKEDGRRRHILVGIYMTGIDLINLDLTHDRDIQPIRPIKGVENAHYIRASRPRPVISAGAYATYMASPAYLALALSKGWMTKQAFDRVIAARDHGESSRVKNGLVPSIKRSTKMAARRKLSKSKANKANRRS